MSTTAESVIRWLSEHGFDREANAVASSLSPAEPVEEPAEEPPKATSKKAKG